MSKRKRLDSLLVERGLVDSREQGRRLILAGKVLIDGQPTTKPGAAVTGNEQIVIRHGPEYVSRAGLKLAAALDRFEIQVAGLVAADIGASTGGFTDCLLQRGVVRVYAIDVGYGQLAWKLRQDPRVVVMERVNARYLENLPEPIDLATFDVSFISLKLVIPPVLKLLKPSGFIIALVKPQFEAGREQVSKGGVVKDPALHRLVLHHFFEWAHVWGLGVRGLAPSPVRGPAGNKEFLAYLVPGCPDLTTDLETLIAQVVTEPLPEELERT